MRSHVLAGDTEAEGENREQLLIEARVSKCHWWDFKMQGLNERAEGAPRVEWQILLLWFGSGSAPVRLRSPPTLHLPS